MLSANPDLISQQRYFVDQVDNHWMYCISGYFRTKNFKQLLPTPILKVLFLKLENFDWSQTDWWLCTLGA